MKIRLILIGAEKILLGYIFKIYCLIFAFALAEVSDYEKHYMLSAAYISLPTIIHSSRIHKNCA